MSKDSGASRLRLLRQEFHVRRYSQTVPLACLRSGIWGTASLWGRVQTYRGSG